MSKQAQFENLLNVEISETSNSCNITADVTGFYADDISVCARNEMLLIEIKSKHQPHQSYYLGEMEPECHVRTIPLGFTADPSSIMTHCNNGKLEILVSKHNAMTTERTASAA